VIRFVEIAVGTGGGVRCARCHGTAAPAAYTSAFDVARDIESAVVSWSGAPGPNIALIGPDPFGHPELRTLVSAAVRAGVQRLRVDTDAVALRSAQNAADYIGAGVRHLSFSLLGGTPGIHDALVDAPGSLDALIAGVRSYRTAADAESLSVCVTAVLPACRHNVRDLPAAVVRAVEIGADAVLVRVEDGGADLSRALPWLTAACDTGVVNCVWVELEGVPFCMLEGYDLHLTDAVRERAGGKSPVCAECALDAVCGGGPPASSGEITGALRPPPFAQRLAPSVARAREGAPRDG
jgi:MoaA/NifB/PqqE/SkfB family radical SAM enzyme